MNVCEFYVLIAKTNNYESAYLNSVGTVIVSKVKFKYTYGFVQSIFFFFWALIDSLQSYTYL